MASFGVIQQGKFTSDGASKILNIRSDFDWIRVYDYTQIYQGGSQTADKAVEFYWQRGMASGQGLKWTLLGAQTNDTVNINVLAAGTGFTPINQADRSSWVSTSQATTAISAAASPVVSTAATNVSVGDIVLMTQTAADKAADDATALMGIPWQVGAVSSGVSYTFGATLSAAPAGLTGAAGDFRLLNPESAFLPALRYITQVDVSDPLLPVVYTSVKHGLAVGDKVRFNVPSSLNGMVQAHGLVGTVTDATTNAYYFTCNLDTTGFDAFVFPTSANVSAASGYTPASVIPYGMDTAYAIAQAADVLADATYNQLVVGVKLAGGADMPGGANNDVMYWVAGKSFSVDNA